MKLSSFITATLALAFVCAGCSKPSPEEQKKQEAELTAALASAMATPSAAAPNAGGGAAGAVLATCVDKNAGTCREYLGLVPMMAEDFCKRGDTGKFAKGSTPCPRDGLVGTCTSKGDDASEIGYRYKGNDETFANAASSAKIACDMVSGAWVAMAPPPAAAPPPKAAGKGKKK